MSFSNTINTTIHHEIGFSKNIHQSSVNSSSPIYSPTTLYLRQLSGQEKECNIIELDHSYTKPWNHHPDDNIKSRPAKFLFMENFPKHFNKKHYINVDEEQIIVDRITDEMQNKPNMFIEEAKQLGMKINPFETSPNEPDEDIINVNKNNWNSLMHKLWNSSLRILNANRLGRLAYAKSENEMILSKYLQDKTCSKFRYLFAVVANWDFNVLNWLHVTLIENLSPSSLTIYVDTMQSLRQKLPSLIDKFCSNVKSKSLINTKIHKQSLQPDIIQSILNNYKPKRLTGSPLFLIVPNGPQIFHQFTSQRMKHWHSIFGSLGKVITINISNTKSDLKVTDCLKEIRLAVKEKINECKLTFSESRPLVLVGFGHSSLIAASCSLECYGQITATICLGFPLTGINGFRGDLDDPLLETKVPTLFIIGQNSTMCTLDDIEDFRERMTKAETGLVVVGGANDRLIICNNKKKFNCITQTMVDRCISDEIYDFLRQLS